MWFNLHARRLKKAEFYYLTAFHRLAGFEWRESYKTRWTWENINPLPTYPAPTPSAGTSRPPQKQSMTVQFTVIYWRVDHGTISLVLQYCLTFKSSLFKKNKHHRLYSNLQVDGMKKGPDYRSAHGAEFINQYKYYYNKHLQHKIDKALFWNYVNYKFKL